MLQSLKMVLPQLPRLQVVSHLSKVAIKKAFISEEINSSNLHLLNSVHVEGQH